jgi:[calcium/calmodulin-dependent protein kinase] kinase
MTPSLPCPRFPAQLHRGFPTKAMEGGPAVCYQDPRAELVERVAAINVAHFKEAGGSPEPTRNGVEPRPRARAASVIPGGASRPSPVRPSLSARKLSLQERPAGSCLEAQAGPYATGPASHIPPQAWRRPTIESHHVAISDTEVGGAELGVAHEPPKRPTWRSTFARIYAT